MVVGAGVRRHGSLVVFITMMLALGCRRAHSFVGGVGAPAARRSLSHSLGLITRPTSTPPSCTNANTNSRMRMLTRLLMAASGGGDANAAAKKVLVPVADGSEEIEAVAIIDTLVRGGASVTVASVMPELQVTCSRGVKLVADKPIAECTDEDWDLIVCPGGLPGANHLRDSAVLVDLLSRQRSGKKLYGAICASPAVVLQTHGLLQGNKATCYPADRFTGTLESYQSGKAVVVDGNVVTSQGPGTSFQFALSLVDLLFGAAKAKEVADGMLLPYP